MLQCKAVVERRDDLLGFQLPKDIVEKGQLQENQELKVILPEQKQTTERVVFILLP